MTAIMEQTCDKYGCSATGEPDAEWTTNQGKVWFRMCEKHHEEYLERGKNWHPGRSVFRSCWPMPDPDALIGLTQTIAIQVNGKLRGTVEAPSDALEQTVEQLAYQNDRVKAHIEGKHITRKVFVEGHVMNFVTSD